MTFLKAITESMNDNSILVSQTGIAPKITDPDETYSPRHSSRVKFIDGLDDIGFAKIFNYETVSIQKLLLYLVVVASRAVLSYNMISFRRIKLTTQFFFFFRRCFW